jgi:hypothetical protein
MLRLEYNKLTFLSCFSPEFCRYLERFLNLVVMYPNGPVFEKVHVNRRASKFMPFLFDSSI